MLAACEHLATTAAAAAAAAVVAAVSTIATQAHCAIIVKSYSSDCMITRRVSGAFISVVNHI